MNGFRLSLIGHLVIHLLLLWMVWKSTPKKSPWRRGVLIAVIFEMLLLSGFYAARWHLSREVLTTVLRLFNSYYVAMLVYCTLVLIFFGVIALLKRSPQLRTKEQRTRTRAYSMLAMIPVTLLLGLWGYHNTFSPVVKHYTVQTPGRESEELKLVLVTDIHIGEIIGEKSVARLVELVKAEEPDYVLVGGDILDYLLEYGKDPEIIRMMDQLHPNPQQKVVYILGNHEYYHQLKEKEAWLRQRGILLKDSVMPLTDQVWLIGRDEYHNKERLPLNELVAQLPEGAVKLLLDHQPVDPQEVRDNKINLSMHGHTHRGQFIPFKWLVELYFERAYGHYQKNDFTHHIISSGYGVSTAPLRLGSRSEIVVIDLKVTPTPDLLQK
ncbi:MAG: metallophosphoesterase [Porphyromonas sp.]|nr:metallophosphoesterase [Porphyromonas sp.]